VVGCVQRVQDDGVNGGRGSWPTVAPGHDAKADTQADADRKHDVSRRKTSLTIDPVRVHAGPAVTTAAANVATAVE